ncbi:hypothetical protein D9753_32585 [Streptomyces dangxiongensis]|uniref:Uncharacterized protein n=1 Tax=Streptomyces dangxiongensis TaxID=1442032 RepID=A0A3G2JML5_9ACTN|nr:hypothetical protein D9753_32585 [Streptomyces dangxiongensis]
MSVAGCTTVRPGALPDPARSQRPFAPDAAATPSALNAPLSPPSGPAALVRTGPGHREGHAPAVAPEKDAAPESDTAPVRKAAPAVPHRVRPAAPRVHPPRRRSPAWPPAPRPAHRPPTERMRDLCRRADGVAAPDVVGLCRSTFG